MTMMRHAQGSVSGTRSQDITDWLSHGEIPFKIEVKEGPPLETKIRTYSIYRYAIEVAFPCVQPAVYELKQNGSVIEVTRIDYVRIPDAAPVDSL